MKKRGTQSVMEVAMMIAATRGMVCREKTKRFMRIPPNSIPKAAAGRFTAPGGGAGRGERGERERQRLVCVRRPGSVGGHRH